MERTKAGNRIYPISTHVIFMQSETPRRKVAACSLSLAFPVSPQGARVFFFSDAAAGSALHDACASHGTSPARRAPSPPRPFVRATGACSAIVKTALGHGPSALDNAVGSREIKSLAVFSAEAIEVRIAIKRRPTH
ncbi:hypothetical protein [Burkholderia pseudomallei]|nr:hypothetical protein [Burkholderia pseudomallei]